MQPSMKKRFTRVLPTVVLHSAIPGMHVEATRRCETTAKVEVLAKLAQVASRTYWLLLTRYSHNPTASSNWRLFSLSAVGFIAKAPEEKG